MLTLTNRQRFLVQSMLAVRRIGRGMTLGVRALIINQSGVALVRHTYVPGWYLPGGAVDGGETVHAAVVREVREETAIELLPPLQLFGVYRNASTHPRDHVALFVSRSFRMPEQPFSPNREIAEFRFFRPHALPEDATEATRNRIDEVLFAREAAHDW